MFRVLLSHSTSLLQNATHQHQTALMIALKSLIIHPVLEIYPRIAEHIFDVAVVLSDLLADDVRIQLARAETAACLDDPRCSFIVGSAMPIDGWLILTKPVPQPQPPSQPQIPAPQQGQQNSPMSGSGATPQQRYFNQQQQRQQQMQAQQAQQLRNYPQYPQHTHPQNKMLPAQLQRNPSNQATPTPLQQMQHMQHMQSLAQQRATQPSPVQSQRATPAAGGGPGAAGGGVGTQKLPGQPKAPAVEVRQFPFQQPRWEILAESSGNSNANETAINLSLFGARRA